MKTYNEIITKPRLVIEHDQDAKSPRANDNIGLFFTKESRYKSPDGNMHPLYQIMIETADEAKGTNHHIGLMQIKASEAFKASAPKDGNSHDEGLHIVEIHPVYRHEHSGVCYKRGTAGGLDYSNCGFYIITAESISDGVYTSKKITEYIDLELEEYTKWCNGEVYAYSLYGEEGELLADCGGYYDIEDIRNDLPDEWKDENLNDYIV